MWRNMRVSWKTVLEPSRKMVLAGGEAQLELTATGKDRTAAHAGEIALILQQLQVFANGDVGYTQLHAEAGNAHFVLPPQFLDDAVAARLAGEHTILRQYSVLLRYFVSIRSSAPVRSQLLHRAPPAYLLRNISCG
jgi:hypothetical protein